MTLQEKKTREESVKDNESSIGMMSIEIENKPSAQNVGMDVVFVGKHKRDNPLRQGSLRVKQTLITSNSWNSMV